MVKIGSKQSRSSEEGKACSEALEEISFVVYTLWQSVRLRNLSDICFTARHAQLYIKKGALVTCQRGLTFLSCTDQFLACILTDV